LAQSTKTLPWNSYVKDALERKLHKLVGAGQFLVAHFGDAQCGAAEPFMLGFTFKNREQAERLAAWSENA
jgi:hypothetical protein